MLCGRKSVMDPEGSHIMAGAVICVLLVALRAYFTCCETALTEISDSRVKDFEHEKGRKGILFRLLENTRRLMTAFSAQRIINSVMITLAAEAALPIDTGHPTRSLPFGAAVILIAVITASAIGDELPRRLMRGERADSFAVSCAPAVLFLVTVIKPVAYLSELIAGGIASLLGASDAEDAVTEEEILMMVDAGSETGSIDSSEREMINNVFEFHDMTVSDVMTHRTRIVGADINSEISEVVYAAINSGFSRLPVYSGSIDHIEGIIYVKDLLCLIGSGTSEGITVKNFLREAEFVPESCMCGDLFKKLTARRLQLAIAVDEYGGTAGLVTMEDLVEAIVGNIRDEYDNEDEELIRLSDGSYIISGSADAKDTMEELGFPLPDNSEYDTMGGFVTDLLGRIPEEGENPSAVYKKLTFTVLLAEDMRIVRIKAVINDDENEEKESEQNEQKKE